MHIRRLFIIIAACVLVLLLLANIFQIVFWQAKVKKVEDSYVDQVSILEEKLGSIGPVEKAWTVAKKVTPGQKITQEDLKPIELLKKSIGDTFVIDPKTVVGKYYKVAILPGTPLTKDVVMEEKMKNSLRQYEVVANTIPIALMPGDYIDFRFLMPGGEDYIALAHKRVESVLGKTVTLYLSEEEIHVYQSMLVDFFLREGSLLYMTKYLEPGVQEAAKTYYPVSENILSIMLIDPNIVDKLENAVVKGSRDILNTADDNISEKTRALLKSGRSTVQGTIDDASALYLETVDKLLKEYGAEAAEKMIKENGIKDDSVTGQTPKQSQQQQQQQPPQTGTKQPPDNNPSTTTQTSPASTSTGQQDKNTGSTSDGKLKIQEGIVE